MCNIGTGNSLLKIPTEFRLLMCNSESQEKKGVHESGSERTTDSERLLVIKDKYIKINGLSNWHGRCLALLSCTKISQQVVTPLKNGVQEFLSV